MQAVVGRLEKGICFHGDPWPIQSPCFVQSQLCTHAPEFIFNVYRPTVFDNKRVVAKQSDNVAVPPDGTINR